MEVEKIPNLHFPEHIVYEVVRCSGIEEVRTK